MSMRKMSPVPFLFALILALAAAPADAQGRGQGKGKQKQEEVRRQEDVRPVLQRRDVEDEWGVYQQRRTSVPRGWCQGKGNPHNTVENCGYQAASNSRGTYRGGGSYEQQHAEFHRYLDDRYRSLAAQRPLDVRRQLELRAQNSAEHNRWHAQAGVRHD